MTDTLPAPSASESQPDTSLARRFLDACADIEKALARRYAPDAQGLREVLAAARHKGDKTVVQNRVGDCILPLTTNAIARLVAEHAEGSDVVLELGTLQDGLGRLEPDERAAIVSRTTTAADVLALLSHQPAHVIVVITEHGRANERPLGVLTSTVVPNLVAAVSA